MEYAALVCLFNCKVFTVYVSFRFRNYQKKNNNIICSSELTLAMASQMTARLKELSYFRALGFTIKSVNLKNVKSIQFRFNPFEENVSSAR